MAEVVNIPKPSASYSTREHSSLESGGLSNANRPKASKAELKGSVTVPKPSFARKLKETFIAEDARDVGDYILWDILVPTIKRTIRDIIVGSTDRIFLGTSVQTKSSNLYRERGVTFVRSGPSSNVTAVSNHPAPYKKSNFRLDEIAFDYNDDAQEALDLMVEYLSEYGKVSVDTFFEIIGQSSPYTAENWGWTSLTNATIVRSNFDGKYHIKFPNPVVIR